MSVDLLIGIHSVAAVLEHDSSNIIELFVESGSHNPRVQALIEMAREQGIKAQIRPRDALDRLSEGERHQGVIARYRTAPPRGESDLADLIAKAGNNAMFLVLDGVTDPHNLGACLRSAEAAGVTAVITPKDRAVGVTSIVRRASAGAADRIPLVVVTNLARTLKQLKEAGVWLIGLVGDAEQSLYALKLIGPIALVLGSEGEGMRRLTRESCDFLARIPMQGQMESLNVSVATGVVLFEALRQREHASGS